MKIYAAPMDSMPGGCEECKFGKKYGAVGDIYCRILENYFTGNLYPPYKERPDVCPLVEGEVPPLPEQPLEPLTLDKLHETSYDESLKSELFLEMLHRKNVEGHAQTLSDEVHRLQAENATLRAQAVSTPILRVERLKVGKHLYTKKSVEWLEEQIKVLKQVCVEHTVEICDLHAKIKQLSVSPTVGTSNKISVDLGFATLVAEDCSNEPYKQIAVYLEENGSPIQDVVLVGLAYNENNGDLISDSIHINVWGNPDSEDYTEKFVIGKTRLSD